MGFDQEVGDECRKSPPHIPSHTSWAQDGDQGGGWEWELANGIC